MNIKLLEITERLRSRRGCRILPVQGHPNLISPYMLPEDLFQFYTFCGGVVIGEGQDFCWQILPPSEFKPANPILLPESIAADCAQRMDISVHWYHLCRGAIPTEHIVIDLHPERRGRCYDAFLQNYATGDMKIIASSFTELLASLATGDGSRPFWEAENFKSLGYAYDDVYGP